MHAGGIGNGKRPRNEMNLIEALAEALDGKSVGVTEVTEAVQKTGYRTTSPSLRTVVNQTLINSGTLNRIERGVAHGQGVIGVISRQLRHSDTSTTARYLDHIAPWAVVRVISEKTWMR